MVVMVRDTLLLKIQTDRQMKTRILQTKIWKDEYFCSLNTQEKLLFLYFLTNDKVNILHCYEISSREASFDTGIPAPIVDKARTKFKADGKLGAYKNWLYILNAYKYEEYKGDKNDTAKGKLVKEMSNDVLDWYKAILDTGIDRGIDTPPIPSINHKSEIINNNIGVVKGKKLDYLLDIPQEDIREFSSELEVTPEQVTGKAKDLYNYCKARGKTYQDYKAFLRNAIKRDFTEKRSYKFGVTKI